MQQPPLLQRRRALAGAHQPVQDKRLGLAQIPARDGHQVLGEPAQRPHALVAVHQHEPLGRLAPDDHHRHLLADLRQRRHQLALGLGFARPQLLVAQVQLVELEVHGPLASRPAAPGRPLDSADREPGPAPGTKPAARNHPRSCVADRAPAEVAAKSRGIDRWGVGALPGSLARLILWPRQRVSGRARPRGTPMRHLSPRLAAREVLLLPSLVIGPPRLALLVLRARPLHPLPAGHRRARRAIEVAPITGAADAHAHPASCAREHPRLGRRHRPGVPRALQIPPRTRSSYPVIRSIAPPRPVTRRPGMLARASTLRTPAALLATPSRAEAIGSASPPVGHFSSAHPWRFCRASKGEEAVRDGCRASKR